MNRRDRSCTGKVRYKNNGRAKKGVRDLKERTGCKDIINCYECEFCGFWHIGRATKYILSRIRVLGQAKEPTMNWAATSAQLAPDSDGSLSIHFKDDQGRESILTVEGNCHVYAPWKTGDAKHGDDVTPHAAFKMLMGISAAEAMERPDDAPKGYWEQLAGVVQRLPTLPPDDMTNDPPPLG